MSHQNFSSQCLIQMSHQNVSSTCLIKIVLSTCLIKMSHEKPSKGLLLAPAEGFGLWPRHIWPLANPFLAFGQDIEVWVVNPSKVHP